MTLTPLMPHTHLTISSDPSQLKAVRDAVLELAAPCVPSQAHMVVLAVDEAVSNVMRHGYGTAPAPVAEALLPDPAIFPSNAETRSLSAPAISEKNLRNVIDVDIRSADGRLEICIADSGPAYNPCEARTEELADRVRARKRGGMGLSIIRRVMDEVHYSRESGLRNELRLIKYFETKE